MADLPYMQLYISDFEADTAHLNFEEDGAYNRLLRLCWRTSGCSIPNDVKWIARHMRANLDTYHNLIEPIIREFFTVENGRIFQKRQRAEWTKARELSDKRAKSGRIGGLKSKPLKTKETDASKASVLLKQLELEPELYKEPPISPKGEDDFGVFWKAYPRKIAKAKAAQSWRTARRKATAETIMAGLAKYLPLWRGKQAEFIPHASTWLNQERWADELEPEDDPLANQGIRHADSPRNPASGGDNGSAPPRNGADDMPRVQLPSAEEDGPMSERDIQAGWLGLDVLALRT